MRKIAVLAAGPLAAVVLLSGSPAQAVSTGKPYVLQHARHGWTKAHKPHTIRSGHGFSLRRLHWTRETSRKAVAHGRLVDAYGSTGVLVHMSRPMRSHGVRYYSVLLYQTRLMGDYMRWSWRHDQWEFCTNSCS